MSSNTLMENYILNPLTRRSIVKNGRVYRRLLKEGHIKLEIPEENDEKEEEKAFILKKREGDEDVKESETGNKFEQMLENLAETDIADSKIAEIIAKASQQVIDKYKVNLEKIESEEELYDEVRRLVQEEIKLLL